MKSEKLTRQAAEVLRFGVVGGVSTLLNYGVFFLLFCFAYFPYLLASAVGFISGTLLGYLLNSKWTFGAGVSRGILAYFSIYTASLGSSLGLLWLLSSVLMVDPRLGNLVSLGYSTVFNYLSLRLIVFKSPRRPI